MTDQPFSRQAIAEDLAGWPDQQGFAYLNNLPAVFNAIEKSDASDADKKGLLIRMRICFAAEEFLLPCRETP